MVLVPTESMLMPEMLHLQKDMANPRVGMDRQKEKIRNTGKAKWTGSRLALAVGALVLDDV